MKNLEKKILLGSVLILLGSFVIIASNALDPDFGWHLAMGKLILEKGIPSTDPFSYTMASFPFIDHEWLTNTALWQIHSIFGKGTLVLFFISLVYATAYFLQKIIGIYLKRFFQKPSLKHSYIVMILSIATLLPFFGIRPQVESWLLLTGWILILDIFLYTFNSFTIYKKCGCYLIAFLITMLWTNLHGSFPLAVVSSIIVTVTKTIEERKIWKSGLALTILVLTATALNPYGLDIWKEVFQQMSDSQLRWRISEWIPALFGAPFTSLLLVSISLPLQIRYYKDLPKPLLALSSFLFVQAFGSVRHIPLWVISSAPLTTLSLEFFRSEVSNITHGKKRFDKAVYFLFYLSFGIIIYQSFPQIYKSQQALGYKTYPDGAIAYLENNIPKKQVFAPYHWGGYLIWKFPEKKVFIDGRMPSWRWDNNPPNESPNVMDEYVHLLYQPEEFEEIFSKYSIQTALLSQTQSDNSNVQKMLSRYSDKVPALAGGTTLAHELENAGWQKVYEDEIAIIYQQPSQEITQ